MDDTTRRIYFDLCACADNWKWTAKLRHDGYLAAKAQEPASALVLRLQAEAANARSSAYSAAAAILAGMDGA